MAVVGLYYVILPSLTCAFLRPAPSILALDFRLKEDEEVRISTHQDSEKRPPSFAGYILEVSRSALLSVERNRIIGHD